MQLLYAWIDDHNNITNQGFCFSSDYYITYDQKNIFSFEPKPKIPKGFYQLTRERGDGQITNVTAIVGSNGSGKTSLLEFICSWSSSRFDFSGKPKDGMRGMIMFEEGGTIFLYVRSNEEERQFSMPKQIQSFSIEIGNPKKIQKFQRDSRIYHSLIPSYFSTSWTDRVTRSEYKEYELMNISNSYNFYESHFGMVVDRKRSTTYRFVDFVDRHNSEDVKKQISFIDANKSWIGHEFAISDLKNFQISIVQKYTHRDDFIELFKTISVWYVPKTEEEFLQIFFVTASLLAYIYPSDPTKQKYFNNGKDWLGELDLLYFLEGKEKSFDLFLEYLRNHPLHIKPVWTESIINSPKKVKTEDFKVPETILFLEFIRDSFKSNSISIERNGRKITKDFSGIVNSPSFKFNPFTIVVPFRLSNEFLKLYLNHLSTDSTSDYLEFHPLPLSSGESSLLTMYARLEHGYENFILNFEDFIGVRNTDTNKMILMIDECDAWMHPQWQKKIVNNLLSYLPRVFKGMEIQLIFTSHSPLLLSDLLMQDVVFLKRDGRKSGIVSELNDHKETFASNIYTLLSDSFFVSGGFIGDFSKGKIDHVIKILRKKLSDIKETELEEIRFITEHIGEPIIRNKLLNLQQEKVGADLITIYDRLKKVEKKTNLTKNRKNDTGKKR